MTTWAQCSGRGRSPCSRLKAGLIQKGLCSAVLTTQEVLTTQSQDKVYQLRTQSPQDSSYFRHQPQAEGSQATQTTDQLVKNVKVSMTHSSLIIHQNNSQNLGKHCTHHYSFTRTKGFESEPAKRSHRIRSRRAPTRSLHVLPSESGCHPPSSLYC